MCPSRTPKTVANSLGGCWVNRAAGEPVPATDPNPSVAELGRPRVRTSRRTNLCCTSKRPKDLADFPDGSALDNFHHPSVVASSVDLNAHLGGYIGLLRHLGDLASLGDRVRQRFFAVDVLPQGQGDGCGGRVGVIGGRNDNRVDPIGLLIEHSAEIAVFARVWVGLGRLVQIVGIDVTQRNHVLALQFLDVVPTLVGTSDNGQIQFLVG